MKTTRSLAILLGTALAAFTLLAQEEKDAPAASNNGGPRGGNIMTMNPLIVALDTNKDGTISATELDNATAALKTLDKNGDGSLTEDEVRPSFGGASRGPGGPGGDTKGKSMPGADSKDPKGGMDKAGKGSKGGMSKGGKGAEPSTGEVVPKRPAVENE